MPRWADRPPFERNKRNAVNAVALRQFWLDFLNDMRASALTPHISTYPRQIDPGKTCAGMKQGVSIWRADSVGKRVVLAAVDAHPVGVENDRK
jgi:hypothetical protein